MVTIETEYEVVDKWEFNCDILDFMKNRFEITESIPNLIFESNTERFNEFFCDDIEKNDFIFIRKDFEKYINDVKDKILNTSKPHTNKSDDLKSLQEALNIINSLNHTEKIKMTLNRVENQSKFYISVNDFSNYYDLMVQIIIPEISNLSILKLKNEENLLYYFKLSMKCPYEKLPDFDIFERNRIFFGAPGTGKSFKLNKDIKKLICNENDYERVTFHPDYSYSQFVGTYKPVPKEKTDGETDEGISYEYVPGPFMRILTKAIENSKSSFPRPFLLVIEEINRANMAAVFGDVFQLLDRDEDNNSLYPINLSEDMKIHLKKKISYELDTIKIPSNMYIWATMNSADQGVFPMDTAFKRRWNFEYMDINHEEKKIKDISFGINDEIINWNCLRKSINKFLLKSGINEDKLLGPFFVSNIQELKENSSKFIDIFKSKVLMYLFEDAAKSIKNTVFEPISNENLSYSTVCKEFESKGIHIFHKDIKDYYEKLIDNE